MVAETKNSGLKFGIIVLTTIISLKLWSFNAIDESIMNIIEIGVLCILLVIFLYNVNKIQRHRTLFKANVYLFIAIPFVSAFGALVFHRQPYMVSVMALRIEFYWLLYFILHVFEIPAKKVVNLILVTGCIWIFLTSAQQFTYPTYYFFTRDEENHSIFRAGVYRFMVLGQQYGLFVLFYFFYRYLNTFKIYNMILVMAGLAGFYYYGTRQFAVAAIVCMLVAILFIKASSRFKILFMMVSAIFIVWVFAGIFMAWSLKDTLLNQYVEMTNEQFQYGDDIRLLSIKFYLFEYWPHWIAKIIGNGQSYGTSPYGMEMDLIRGKYHYYRSDVGIIGAYNAFGIFYVINIIWLNIKGLFNKFYTYEGKYLKLFYINSLFLLILSEYYSNGSGIPFYCFILYLTDKSYEEKNSAQDLVSES